jgi:anti-sigma B factor antagonist
MPAPDGVLRMSVNGGTVTFQVDGPGTVRQGLPMRRFAESCLNDGITRLRVDLRNCTWMDSTFVGTLLVLLKTITRRGRGDFSVVSPSATSRRVLKQMGVEMVCPVCDAEEPAGPWLQVDSSPDDGETFKCQVLQAHEELAELPGPAGETFRAMVRCLSASRTTTSTS